MEGGRQIRRKHIALWNRNRHHMKRQCAHSEHFQQAVAQCFYSFFLSSPSTGAQDSFLSPIVSLCGCCSPCPQPLAGKKVGVNAEMMKVIFYGFCLIDVIETFCQAVIALLTVSRAFTSGKSCDRQQTPGRESYCQWWLFRVKPHRELLLPPMQFTSW